MTFRCPGALHQQPYLLDYGQCLKKAIYAYQMKYIFSIFNNFLTISNISTHFDTSGIASMNSSMLKCSYNVALQMLWEDDLTLVF